MFKKHTDETGLETACTAVLTAMNDLPVGSAEFAKLLDRLTVLRAMRNENRSRRISPDTKAVVLGNLAGIGMILSYEHSRVVASKALSFVLKAR